MEKQFCPKTLKGKKKQNEIENDNAIRSDNIEHNFHDVVNILGTGHKAGIVFNSDKFQFTQESVD